MVCFRNNNDISYRKYPSFIWRRNLPSCEENVDAIYRIGDEARLSEEIGLRNQDGYPEGHHRRVYQTYADHVPEQHFLDNLEEEPGVVGCVWAHARELRPF
jgi:hypothetical protein